MKPFSLLILLAITLPLPARDWEAPSIFRINKEAPRAVAMPFPTAEGAVSKQRLESPWCRMLNGDWRFHWVGHPDQRPADFYRTDFDASSWKTIPVPSNVELQGYGTPVYANQPYHWQFSLEPRH